MTAKLDQKPPRTNGGTVCDVDDGPCSCGAWHRPTDPEVVANPATPSWAALLKEGERFRDADFNTYTVRGEFDRSHGTLLVGCDGGKAAAYVPATWIAKHCVKVEDSVESLKQHVEDLAARCKKAEAERDAALRTLREMETP